MSKLSFETCEFGLCNLLFCQRRARKNFYDPCVKSSAISGMNYGNPMRISTVLLLLILVVPGLSLRIPPKQYVASTCELKQTDIRARTLQRRSCITHPATEDITNGVNILPLAQIDSDALHLKHSIASWLDEEYIPQDIHHKLGSHVETHYTALRSEGVHDLGELLIRMGTSLEKIDMEDAFVNAWDVANKAADLLMSRLGQAANLQVMSHDTTDTMLSKDSVLSALRELESEFARYTLLKDYLDGDTLYNKIHTALALQLGFRLPERTTFEKEGTAYATTATLTALQQYQHLAPLGWENLSSMPDFSAVEDLALAEKMKADLPEDETSSDLIIESMLGLEYFNTVKQLNDPAVLRRVLVTKWMYVQGFLNSVFPPLERFIPFHRLNAEDLC